MAIQAHTVDVPSRSGTNRRDLLISGLMLLIGVIVGILGGFSAQAGDQSAFTDQTLGTLFSLPSRGTLYAIAVFCFFVGGLRLFRGLNSIRSALSWALAFLAAFSFLIITKILCFCLFFVIIIKGR